jgi:hypothetical protein
MMLSRTFTVAAACLFVIALALMVLPADGLTLVQGLSLLVRDAPEQLQRGVTHTLGAGVWLKLFVPLLVRPVWMVPLCLGMLCAGAAVSTLPPAESPRRTGRRL